MIQGVIAIGFMTATLLVGVFFGYLYSLKRQMHVLYWTVGWILYALHLMPIAIEPWHGTNALFSALNQGLFGLAGISFFLGTQSYTRKKLQVSLAIGAAVLVAAWSGAHAYHVISINAVAPGALVIWAWAICSGGRATGTRHWETGCWRWRLRCGAWWCLPCRLCRRRAMCLGRAC